MSKISGIFTNWGEAYGRLVETYIDGTWWTVGDYLDKALAGKCLSFFVWRNLILGV